MSILHPLTCGFAKVACYTLFTSKDRLKGPEKNSKTKLGIEQQNIYDELQQMSFFLFGEFEYQNYYRKLNPIVENIRNLNKRSKEDFLSVLNTFSREKFDKLSDREQNDHIFYNCDACFRNKEYKLALIKFPCKNKVFLKEAENSGLFKEQQLLDNTIRIINELDLSYQKDFGTTFTKQVKAMRSPRKPANNKAKAKLATIITKDIENQLATTAVERTYGLPLSKNNRQKLRLFQGFENVESAEQRRTENEGKIKLGLKRKHNHVGNTSNYQWNVEECLDYISTIIDTTCEVNFSELARKFNVRNMSGNIPGNAGQVLRQIFIENGVEINPENENGNLLRIRRKKRRLNIPNCRDVPLPLEPTNERVGIMLNESIDAGDYNIGRLVVPQIYYMTSIPNGEIVTEEVAIEGRKIRLLDIRRKLLSKHSKYMRLTSDEDFEKTSKEKIISQLKIIGEMNGDEEFASKEFLVSRLKTLQRTRNLMMWHDGSPIGGHGHLLMTISILYDTAVFLTSDEVHELTGQKINIQALIETPEIYLLARCPSNDQQLLYVEERMEDVEELKMPISINSIEISDQLRLFKGDKPASQFEIGQQKGGNFFCFCCSVQADDCNRLFYNSNLPHFSIADRINKLMISEPAIQKSKREKAKIFDNLKKDEIVRELHERKVKFTCTSTTKHLSDLLDYEVHGMQRVPALMFKTPLQSLEECNLDKYEVLFTEPLHDVTNHIKNLYQELPYHVEKEKKNEFKNIIISSFNGKDAKNGADHRKSILIVSKWSHDNLTNPSILLILRTLCEIQEIIYANESKRTMQNIFRLTCLIFEHALTLNIIVKGNVKSLTSRKFFGAYYHSLISHFPLQFRIISGRSANTEKEEAIFSKLKKFTKLTSNHHPAHVILNNIVRYEAKQKLNPYEIIAKEKKIFSTLYKPVKDILTNTKISFHFIKKYAREYQSFLQQIADILLTEKCWIETNGAVEFFDLNNINKISIAKHHYRSTNLKEESKYLKNCWKSCLKEEEKIPAYKIFVYEHDKYKEKRINTLVHFKDQLTNDEINEDIPLTPSLINVSGIEMLEQQTELSEENRIPHTIENIIDFTLGVDTKENSPNHVPSINISGIENLDLDSKPSISSEDKCLFPPITNILQENTDVNKPQSIDVPLIVTSTPAAIKKKKKRSESIQYFAEKKNPDTLSSTSEMLKDVLDDLPLVIRYDKCRKNVKALKSTENIDAYKDCVAVLEVKLKCKKERLYAEMKTIEIQIISKNKTLDLTPSNPEDQHKMKVIQNKLKYIRTLRKELKF